MRRRGFGVPAIAAGLERFGRLDLREERRCPATQILVLFAEGEHGERENPLLRERHAPLSSREGLKHV